MPAVVKSHRQQIKAELAAVATIPKDWPVQSTPVEDFGEDATAYQPGSLVQACSGTDITLARTAVVAPHVGKQKGKFLLILPGMLSLKQSLASMSMQMQSSKDASLTEEVPLTQGKDDEDENCNNDDDHDKNGDAKDDKDQDEEDSKKPAAVASKQPLLEDSKSEDAISNNSNPNSNTAAGQVEPVTLGRVEKLATDAPILVVPFPNGRNLLFPGKKVHTSSKFFMLTCNTRRGRGGSVACKNIFSSVIVFGTPTWEGSASTDVTDVTMEEEEAIAPSLTEMVHYGASERTVDGAAGKGKLQSASTESSSIKVPIITSANYMTHEPSSSNVVEKNKNKDGDDDDDDSSEPQDGPILFDNDEDSGSDLDEFKISVATDSLLKRSTPGRRASTKKTKYAEPDSQDEEEESSDKDQEKNTKPKKKTPTAAKKRASTDSKKKSVPMAGSSPDDNIKGSTKLLEGSDSNDESDDFQVPVSKDASLTKRSTPGRRASTKTTKYTVPGSSASEEEENSEDHDKKKPKSKKLAPKKQASTASKSKQVIDIESSDQEEEEEKEVSSKPAKKPRGRASIAAAASAKKKPATKEESESEEDIIDDDFEAPATKRSAQVESSKPANKPRGRASTATARAKNKPAPKEESESEAEISDDAFEAPVTKRPGQVESSKPANKPRGRASTAAARPKNKPAPKEESQSEVEISEDDFEAPVTKRLAPGRSVSAQKNKYEVPSDLEASEEEDEGNESEDEVVAKTAYREQGNKQIATGKYPRKKATAKKPVAASDGDVTEITNNRKKIAEGAPMKRKSSLSSDEDIENDQTKVNIDEDNSRPALKRARRKSSKKTTTSSTSGGSDAEESPSEQESSDASDFDQSLAKLSASIKAQRATPAKKGLALKTTKKATSKIPAAKKKAMVTKRNKPARSSKGGVVLDDANGEKSVVQASPFRSRKKTPTKTTGGARAAAGSPGTPGKSPSFRSRKKSSMGTSKSSASKVLDLTEDNEFNFL